MNQYDVIAVGAGPAGSTAAKLLAEAGRKVLLLDREQFPRHKPCAAWINAAAPEKFPALADALATLDDNPFYGATFLSPDLSRRADYSQDAPAGHLVLRDRFDAHLKDLAVTAGAEFRGNCEVSAVSDGGESVIVTLADGSTLDAQYVLGADGIVSVVGRTADLNARWLNEQMVICSNEDIACDPATIEKHFGPKPSVLIAPAYGLVAGYGWVFPKRAHVCVGLGGRVNTTKNVYITFGNFFNDLKKNGLIPQELQWDDPDIAMNPAGAAARRNPDQALARGRVMLLGDAGGFCGGSNGEGIYPAMLSAKFAAEAILSGDTDPAARYVEACERELVPLVAGLSPAAMAMINQNIYASPQVAARAARSFLFGEPFGI